MALAIVVAAIVYYAVYAFPRSEIGVPDMPSAASTESATPGTTVPEAATTAPESVAPPAPSTTDEPATAP